MSKKSHRKHGRKKSLCGAACKKNGRRLAKAMRHCKGKKGQAFKSCRKTWMKKTK